MHLDQRQRIIGAIALALASTVAIAVLAQDPSLSPGVEQEFLLTAPLAQFPGKQVTVFTGDFEPGAKTPFHQHPGTELLYVLEGEGTMTIRGHESRELPQGKVVLVEPGAGETSFTHQAANLSRTERMKTLVIVIHDQGSPLATLIREGASPQPQ